MAGVLERTHALQRHAAPDVDVRRRDVDSQLDAQRPAEGELALERACRQDVDCVARERRDRLVGRRH